MTQLFGIPIDTLTSTLVTITTVLVGIVVLLALGNAIFFKIGVRNIPRRRMQIGAKAWSVLRHKRGDLEPR